VPKIKIEVVCDSAIAFDSETSMGEGSWLLIPVRVMVDADDLAAARAIVDDAA
jgi:hypothetical protein